MRNKVCNFHRCKDLITLWNYVMMMIIETKYVSYFSYRYSIHTQGKSNEEKNWKYTKDISKLCNDMLVFLDLSKTFEDKLIRKS